MRQSGFGAIRRVGALFLSRPANQNGDHINRVSPAQYHQGGFYHCLYRIGCGDIPSLGPPTLLWNMDNAARWSGPGAKSPEPLFDSIRSARDRAAQFERPR